jgi:hypothetical protein
MILQRKVVRRGGSKRIAKAQRIGLSRYAYVGTYAQWNEIHL